MTLLRPAPVPVHDHRNMPRQPFPIQFFQDKRFLCGHRTESSSRECKRVSHDGFRSIFLYAAKLTHPFTPAQRTFRLSVIHKLPIVVADLQIGPGSTRFSLCSWGFLGFLAFSVIPTGAAGFFLRAVVWRAGRGVE